jgi:hypothetical protein
MLCLLKVAQVGLFFIGPLTRAWVPLFYWALMDHLLERRIFFILFYICVDFLIKYLSYYCNQIFLRFYLSYIPLRLSHFLL